MYAAKALGNAPGISVTLIDRRNFHLFQPLLYQVATAGLSPGEIASPLRAVLRKYKNITVLMGEVVGFDLDAQKVKLAEGELDYDTLIVAAGSRDSYFGNDQWKPLAPGLKTIEEALDIRRRIFMAYEEAEREPDPEKRKAWLNFVVVGGGPTGVELAGALGEIARQTLKGNFRRFNPADATVILVEGADRVLPPFPPDLSVKAQRALERLGVTVRTGLRVTGIEDDCVTLSAKSGSEKIESTHDPVGGRRAGFAARPRAGPGLRRRGGQGRPGQGFAEPDPSGPPRGVRHRRHGDRPGRKGQALSGPRARRHAAGPLRGGAHQGAPEPAAACPRFHYRDKGTMATIGPAAAVADVGPLHFNGFLAWLAWLFIHLMYIAEFDNRLLVFIQWAYNYFTRNRGVRLITGTVNAPPLMVKEMAKEGVEVKENAKAKEAA